MSSKSERAIRGLLRLIGWQSGHDRELTGEDADLISEVASTSFTVTDAERDRLRERVLNRIEGACSRCKQGIEDFRPPEGGMTAGYYHVHSLDDGCWGKFANPGEKYICDACMWSDPRYIAVYGTQHNPPPSSLPVPRNPRKEE